MGTNKKRRAQEIEFRAAGMTLAQVKRSTARRVGGNGGLILATVALFALAAGAGGYLAFGQSSAPVVTASDTPLAPQVPTPEALVDVTASAPAPAPAEDLTIAAAPQAIAVAPIVEAIIQAPEVMPLEIVAEAPPTPPVYEAASNDCIQDLDAAAAALAVPFAPYATVTSPATLGPLFDLAGQLNTCDGAYLVVAGHADPSGDETQNLLLSWQRAEFVIASLQDAGFDPDRFEAIGFGSRRPLSEGAAGADETLNRRVDFIVRAAQP